MNNLPLCRTNACIVVKMEQFMKEIFYAVLFVLSIYGRLTKSRDGIYEQKYKYYF